MNLTLIKFISEYFIIYDATLSEIVFFILLMDVSLQVDKTFNRVSIAKIDLYVNSVSSNLDNSVLVLTVFL